MTFAHRNSPLTELQDAVRYVGLRPLQIRKLLAAHNWQRPDALAGLVAELHLLYSELASRLRATAGKADGDVVRALRNAVASAPRFELPVWVVLLESDIEIDPALSRELRATYRAAYDQVLMRGEMAVIRRLIVENAALDIELIEQCSKLDPIVRRGMRRHTPDAPIAELDELERAETVEQLLVTLAKTVDARWIVAQCASLDVIADAESFELKPHEAQRFLCAFLPEAAVDELCARFGATKVVEAVRSLAGSTRAVRLGRLVETDDGQIVLHGLGAAQLDAVWRATSKAQQAALVHALHRAGRLEELATVRASDPAWLTAVPTEYWVQLRDALSAPWLLHAITAGIPVPYTALQGAGAEEVADALANPSPRQSLTVKGSVKLLTHEALRWLAHASPELFSTSCGALLAALNGEGGKDTEKRRFAQALALVVKSAAKPLDWSQVFTNGLSDTGYATLLLLISERMLAVDESFLALECSDTGELHWVRRLTRTGVEPASTEQIPEALLVAIAGDIERLEKAVVIAPQVMGREAMRHLPPYSLVRLALRHHHLARWLDGQLSMEQRRSCLTLLKEEFGGRPFVHAALELALLFSLSDAVYLRRLAKKAATAKNRGAQFDDLYHTYALPKRSGGSRLITAPVPELKRLQRRLYERAFLQVPLLNVVTGFRPGFSIVTNATPHVGKALVVSVDIESFFASTTFRQIVRVCHEVLGEEVSAYTLLLMADICSFNGALPTGAPTSPAIGNLVLRRVDQALRAVCIRHDIDYTRYADDLTFSGNGEVQRILPFVRRLLDELGYELKEKKVNLFRRGRRQIVTGLVVNEHPNLPRRIRKRLRAAVHRRVTGGVPEWHGTPMSDDALFGQLAHLGLVQREQSAKLKVQLKVHIKSHASTSVHE